MMSILIGQLINITDAIFLGHFGEIELEYRHLPGYRIVRYSVPSFVPT
ncbi:hypothetical protein [Barnesiella intestinihominis]